MVEQFEAGDSYANVVGPLEIIRFRSQAENLKSTAMFLLQAVSVLHLCILKPNGSMNMAWQ